MHGTILKLKKREAKIIKSCDDTGSASALLFLASMLKNKSSLLVFTCLLKYWRIGSLAKLINFLKDSGLFSF